VVGGRCLLPIIPLVYHRYIISESLDIGWQILGDVQVLISQGDFEHLHCYGYIEPHVIMPSLKGLTKQIVRVMKSFLQ
jgi:hypothetical protein